MMQLDDALDVDDGEEGGDEDEGDDGTVDEAATESSEVSTAQSPAALARAGTESAPGLRTVPTSQCEEITHVSAAGTLVVPSPRSTGADPNSMDAYKAVREQQIAIDAAANQLEQEREAHAQRVARLNIRDAELRARESAQRAAIAQVEALKRQYEDEQREAGWRHWHRDRMRELMRELTSKRPTDEWRRRMERIHIALDLSERENARLRVAMAKASGISVRQEGESESAPPTDASTASVTTFIAAGGPADDLLARYEAVRLEAAQSEEALRLAHRSAASQEAYLGVLQAEAQEAASRNESQQKRLESLTAETSKLRKECAKLRSEVTGARMSNFEHELLAQELRGAKDAAAAMESQLQRLHTENAALRAGGGLRDELASVTQQLKNTLSAKTELQLALAMQVRQANATAAIALAGLADADADIDSAVDIAREHQDAALTTRAQHLRAATLVEAGVRLRSIGIGNQLRWALLTWGSAVCMVELVSVLVDVRQRAIQLGAESEALSNEMRRIEVAESGGLAIDKLQLLHDTSKEVFRAEVLAAEKEARAAQRSCAEAASLLHKRDDDLVLLIQSYEGLKNEHDTLKGRVQSAAEDSTTHAVRLQIELDQKTAMLSSADHSLHKLLQQKENLAQQLIMRERQLALCVTHIEGGRTEMDMPRTHRMDEVANLRNVLAEREQHTVLLIRDLYELASAERAPGVVAHNIRSRIFLRCASIYEQLGEKAFGKDADATKANAMHVQDRAADSSARSVSR